MIFLFARHSTFHLANNVKVGIANCMFAAQEREGRDGNIDDKTEGRLEGKSFVSDVRRLRIRNSVLKCIRIKDVCGLIKRKVLPAKFMQKVAGDVEN